MTTAIRPSTVSAPIVFTGSVVAEESRIAVDFRKQNEILMRTLKTRFKQDEYMAQRKAVSDGFEGVSAAFDSAGMPEAAQRVATFGNGAGKLMDVFCTPTSSPLDYLTLASGAAILSNSLFSRHKKRTDDSLKIIGESIEQAYHALSGQISGMHQNLSKSLGLIEGRVEVMHTQMMCWFTVFGERLDDMQSTFTFDLEKIANELKGQLAVINRKMDEVLLTDFNKCRSYVAQFKDRHGPSAKIGAGPLEFYAPSFENVLFGVAPTCSAVNGNFCTDFSALTVLGMLNNGRPETLMGYLASYAATVLGVPLPSGLTAADIPNLVVYSQAVEDYLALRELGIECDYDNDAVQIKKVLNIGVKALSFIQYIQTCPAIFNNLFSAYALQLKRLKELCIEAMEIESDKIYSAVAERARSENNDIISRREAYREVSNTFFPGLAISGSGITGGLDALRIYTSYRDTWLKWDRDYAAELSRALETSIPMKETHRAKIHLPYAELLSTVNRLPFKPFACPLSAVDIAYRLKQPQHFVQKGFKMVPVALSSLPVHPEGPLAPRLNSPPECALSEQLGLGYRVYEFFASNGGGVYDMNKNIEGYGFYVKVGFQRHSGGLPLYIQGYSLYNGVPLDPRCFADTWQDRVVNWRERGAVIITDSWARMPTRELETRRADLPTDYRTNISTLSQMIKEALVAYRKQAIASLYKDKTTLNVKLHRIFDEIEAIHKLFEFYGDLAGFGRAETMELVNLFNRKQIELYHRTTFMSTTPNPALKEETPYVPPVDVSAIQKKVMAKFSRENGILQNPFAKKLQVQLTKIAQFALYFVNERALVQAREERRLKQEAERQRTKEELQLKTICDMQTRIAQLELTTAVQAKQISGSNELLLKALAQFEEESARMHAQAQQMRLFLETLERKGTSV